MKCVGTPIWPSSVKICSEIRLLSTPLPLIVPFFWALKAVASSLKYWIKVPGSGPLGRVRVEDVRAYAERRKAPPERPEEGPQVLPAGFPPPPKYAPPKGYEHLEERVPLRGIRRTIAWYAANRDRWAGRAGWLPVPGTPTSAA